MIRWSDTTATLDAALAKVQGEIGTALKAKTNPHFKSTYADIAAVWDACRPALARHGVAVYQAPGELREGRLEFATRLACQGEWILSTFEIPVSKLDAQGVGSAISYARRYTLAAAVGVVAADEDDDAEQAVERSSGAPGMADLLAAISSAEDTDNLKAAYFAAQKAAGRDQIALAKIIAATNARKAALAARA